MYSVPPELARLSLAEKLLIQKISPFVPLQHIRQGVMGLKGHVCAFEQDISGVCRDLPKLPSDISIIRIIKEISVEIGNSKGEWKSFNTKSKSEIAVDIIDELVEYLNHE